jgi:Uma2 family endonuclease
MPILVDERWLPAILTAPPMTDEEFSALVADHPNLRFEMNADGELIVMPPNKSKTGARNNEIAFQLTLWARSDGRGTVFDSSTGFVLPNGARRSPDVSWVANTRIEKLDSDQRENYFHLCPDFVIELRSQTDRLPVIREKMREYIENGAALGWMIDPERRAVEVFRPGAAPEIRENSTEIPGEAPVQTFLLELRRVWEPFGKS